MILTSLQKLIFARYQNIDKPSISLGYKQIECLNEFKRKLALGVYNFEYVPCLCGNQDGAKVTNFDRYGLPLNTILCNRCGTMWTSPRMTSDSLEKFYKDDYRNIYVGSNTATDEFFLDQVSHGEKILKFVSSFLTDTHSKKVFDIGCGAGGVLMPFKENGWETYGCDLNSTYLKKGIDNGLTLVAGDEKSLEKFGKADLVMLSHVLEHISNPIDYLQLIREILNDNGLLYIEVPGILNLYDTYGDFRLYFQNAHLYSFTLTTLSSMVAKAGFDLFFGNESIRAIFMKRDLPSLRSSSIEYRKILKYLIFNEIKMFFRNK